MNTDILISQIQIVLEREKMLLSNNEKTWLIDSENNNQIIYEHADTLINIFSGLQDEEQKTVFRNRLIEFFIYDREITKTTPININDCEILLFSSVNALIFYTFYKLGLIKELTYCLSKRIDYCRISDYSNVTLVYFLFDLPVTVKYFNIELITPLLNFIKCQPKGKCSSYDNILLKLQYTFVNTGYTEVKESILGVNIEINKDKEKLVTMFSNYSFDQKYESFLKEIDEYINTNSNIVASGMIGNMRSFMEDLITDIARKIAINSNEEIPENDNMGPMGNFRSYLKTKMELSDKDNQLINKYIDVLHSEGGHSFTSNIEYFRLAKNIGIEISLFLLSKIKNLNLIKNQLEK